MLNVWWHYETIINAVSVDAENPAIFLHELLLKEKFEEKKTGNIVEAPNLQLLMQYHNPGLKGLQ